MPTDRSKQRCPEVAALREASQALLDTVAWYLTRTGVSAADAGLLGVMEDVEAALRGEVPHGD
jgi:hypothetical protein